MRQRAATRFTHTVSPEEDGVRFDLMVGAWLARELGQPLSKSTVRKLIMAGAVRVAGHPVRRPGSLVRAGVRLDAFIAGNTLGSSRAASAGPVDVEILYEDADLIAVAKPPGMLMHATADRTRTDLFTIVRQMLARRSTDWRPGQPLPYLGLHHRLDVETSGAVLFTKDERANGGIAEQFAQNRVTKVYHAIVVRRPVSGVRRRLRTQDPERRTRTMARQWRVENRLAPSGGDRKARMQQAESGAQAVTEFMILETMRAALLVEARPHTGRKHQIRAHLSESGMPILGDRRYGGPPRAADCVARRVMLHAVSLSLRHPTTDAPLAITCPYPRDFAECLQCLRPPET